MIDSNNFYYLFEETPEVRKQRQMKRSLKHCLSIGIPSEFARMLWNEDYCFLDY